MMYAVLMLLAGHAITLADVTGREWDLAARAGQPAVLIYSDREGSRHTAPWLRVAKDYGDRCVLVEVADLSSAPRVARPFVRRAFRQHPGVLLDWRGEIGHAFGFEAGQPNVYVLDTGGHLVTHLRGEAEGAEPAELRAVLEDHCVHPD